jgi:NitT/TauT family transport system substrate-binding protein
MNKLALSLLLLAVLQWAGPSAAQTAAPLIRVGTGPNDPSLTLVYADKGGVFKRAGLNVEVTRQTTTSVMAAAVVGGSLEIAQGSSLGAIQAIAKGLPLTLIGNLAIYNPDSPDAALIVLTDSPIRTAKDLEGKTMAGVALADMNTISTQMWLTARGADVSTLKYVEVPASASLAALEQNRIAAATVYEPFYSTFVATGKVRVLGYPYESISRRFADSVIYAEKTWAVGHGELIARFLRALNEATAYVAAHEAETAPLLAQFVGAQTAAANVHHPQRAVAISPADIQPMIDAAAKFNAIPKAFPAQDIICSCALMR